MPKSMSIIAASLGVVLISAAGTSALAQSIQWPAHLSPRLECGGQYECVEDRPLTLAEARASLGYPRAAQPQEPAGQETAKIAATEPPTTK